MKLDCASHCWETQPLLYWSLRHASHLVPAADQPKREVYSNNCAELTPNKKNRLTNYALTCNSVEVVTTTYIIPKRIQLWTGAKKRKDRAHGTNFRESRNFDMHGDLEASRGMCVTVCQNVVLKTRTF